MLHLKIIIKGYDSSVRTLLKHQYNNPKGRLPEKIIELEWLADPSHRTKVVAKPIYQLAISFNKLSSCTKLDAVRFKQYFGYMIKKNGMKSSSEIGRSSEAVVEYLFDCHVFCDEKWRRPKLNTRLKKKEEDSQSYYR